MAYVFEGNSPNSRRPGPQIAAYGSWFSSIAKAVSKVPVLGGAVKAIGAVTRAVDPTSSKSIIGAIPVVGRVVNAIARPVVATAKVATGITALELAGSVAARAVGSKGVANDLMGDVKATAKPALVGFAAGAAIGGAILAAPAIGAALAGGGIPAGTLTSLIPGQGSSPAATPAAAVPVAPTVPAGAPGGVGALLAGAGAGFLLGGPVGAAVGAGAGYFIGQKG